MPSQPHEQGPFDDPSVVAAYEDWYSTGFGALADELERGLLTDLLGDLDPGASILEVGCGTGHFGAALGALGYRAAGIDLAPEMLQRARARFPVALADGAHLPFDDGSFDAVVLIAVLDFVDDPLAVLREALRAARGPVVVLALVSHSFLAMRRRIAALRGHPIFSRARFYSRRQILAFARQAMSPGTRLRGSRSGQILVLPPFLAGCLPGLERRLSGQNLLCGGILGFRMEATSTAQIGHLS